MNARLACTLACAMAAIAIAAGAARAQDAGTPRQVVIYRCTDAAGHVTIQNDLACPKGTRQQRQAIDAPTPMPAYVPREERMPEVVAAERAAEAAAIAAAVQSATDVADTRAAPAASTGTKTDAGAAPTKPGPPPALYACRTWDQVDYLTEDAKPAERCAPLQVVGMDGAARGDAAACENVVDQCAAVPAENLCQAWRRRVDEAEFRWKFAGAKQDDGRRREYETLRTTLAKSDCQR